eukprot:s687_g3.t1
MDGTPHNFGNLKSPVTALDLWPQCLRLRGVKKRPGLSFLEVPIHQNQVKPGPKKPIEMIENSRFKPKPVSCFIRSYVPLSFG